MSDAASRGRYTPIHAPGGQSPSSSVENVEFFDAHNAAPQSPRTNIYNHMPTSVPNAGNDPETAPFTPSHETVEGMSSSLASVSNLAGSSAANAGNARDDLESQRSATPGRLSAVERMKNVVTYLFPFKQTYERLNNGLTTGRLQSNAPGRFVGQGTDGVFRNLMAKPDPESTREIREQHPPTYEEAAADSSPEYWEATMISPMYDDEVFVHGLPVGNIANFVWNVLVTVAFQLVGFVLCYLLHTSHAAKQGTRAGLGITIMMYGYNAIPSNFGRPDRVPTRYEPIDPNSIDISKSSSIKNGGAVDTYSSGFVQNSDINGAHSGVKTPLLAYAIIAFGVLVLLKSFVDFFNVKKEERRILAPQASEQVHSTTETVDNPPPS
ncbi:hypothetical protein JCM33374_g6302 [Metschnikowia sp. JCM 33374]|nr:hypothetical protein JCM33374_g6302 [Metschnikowia sp. JCM 33374]